MILDLEQFADLVAAKVLAQLPKAEPDEVLKTEGAAALLGIHPTTCSQLALAREIPGRKVGKEWRFSRRALLAYLSETENTAPDGGV